MLFDTTLPIIAWKNLFEGATYTIVAGAENPSMPFANAFNGMMSSIAVPTADANGVFQANISLAQTNTGFSSLPFGREPFAGVDAATCLIVGGSRHNPANQHWTGGSITINGVETRALLEPSNMSVLMPFNTAHTTQTVTFRIDGLQANQPIFIPELFYGGILQMPAPEYGFDPTADHVNITSFHAVSGARYDYVHHIKQNLTPSWQFIDPSLAYFIETFRETVLEQMAPFWWIYNPYGTPQPVFMKHIAPTAPMPFKQAYFRNFQLKLEEVLL